MRRMNIRILRVCVLLVSISAASVLVWNATRDQKPKQTQEEKKISPKKMQGSSKVREIIGADVIEEITQETELPIVTDEEVKNTREAMLSTSKSGRVMSDDQIREMLENRKKFELKHEKEQRFMPSSKSIDAVLRRNDVEGLIEGGETEEKLPLIPSSKNPSHLIDPEEVEKVIKRDASDFINPVEPEK